MDDKTCAHVIISGRVQGVFFRMKTKETADRLGISGWVKNRADGKVEALFEGEKECIDKMLAWCGKGPLLSKVTDVAMTFKAYSGGYSSFNITY